MLLGNVILGIGVAIFKLSGLGNDPYTGMIMALADRVHMQYANFLVQNAYGSDLCCDLRLRRWDCACRNSGKCVSDGAGCGFYWYVV